MQHTVEWNYEEGIERDALVQRGVTEFDHDPKFVLI
jgi:hypothetical protein